MATPEDDGQLDELANEIETARKQAEDHGTIPERGDQEVEYQQGDLVGVPDPETTPDTAEQQ